MRLLSIHCRLCGSSKFKTDPPEGWLETYLLPRFLTCPARCTACLTRRYCPMFLRLDTTHSIWR